MTESWWIANAATAARFLSQVDSAIVWFSKAIEVADKMIEHDAELFRLYADVFDRLGIETVVPDGDDFDTLCKCADAAMYRAKRDGRNAYRFFTSEMQAQSARALQLENALRRAQERCQLSLHYQPQFALDDAGTLEEIRRLKGGAGYLAALIPEYRPARPVAAPPASDAFPNELPNDPVPIPR